MTRATKLAFEFGRFVTASNFVQFSPDIKIGKRSTFNRPIKSEPFCHPNLTKQEHRRETKVFFYHLESSMLHFLQHNCTWTKITRQHQLLAA